MWLGAFQSLYPRPSALKVCVSDGGPVWLNTMGENQNPSNTCLSVSQMDSSGTHLNTHAQKNSSLVSIVINMSCGLLWSPVQCYGETTYCWCVDQDGREIAGTRSYDAVKPACECSFNTMMMSLCLCVCVQNVENHCSFLSVQTCPRPSLSCSAHSAPIAPPRCDPTTTCWRHTSVCSGTENRGIAP